MTMILTINILKQRKTVIERIVLAKIFPNYNVRCGKYRIFCFSHPQKSLFIP